MEPENQAALLPFLKRLKAEYEDKDIWAYTGYLLDKDLISGGKCYTINTEELLSFIDVLVDGPYLSDEGSLMLKFKGSANQRIIDCKHFVKSGEIRICM